MVEILRAPARSGLISARSLSTRIILVSALERSLIRVAHDLGGEPWMKVCFIGELPLPEYSRAMSLFGKKAWKAVGVFPFLPLPEVLSEPEE